MMGLIYVPRVFLAVDELPPSRPPIRYERKVIYELTQPLIFAAILRKKRNKETQGYFSDII